MKIIFQYYLTHCKEKQKNTMTCELVLFLYWNVAVNLKHGNCNKFILTFFFITQLCISFSKTYLNWWKSRISYLATFHNYINTNETIYINKCNKWIETTTAVNTEHFSLSQSPSPRLFCTMSHSTRRSSSLKKTFIFQSRLSKHKQTSLPHWFILLNLKKQRFILISL